MVKKHTTQSPKDYTTQSPKDYTWAVWSVGLLQKEKKGSDLVMVSTQNKALAARPRNKKNDIKEPANDNREKREKEEYLDDSGDLCKEKQQFKH